MSNLTTFYVGLVCVCAAVICVARWIFTTTPSRTRWDLDVGNVIALVNVAEFAKRSSARVKMYYTRTTSRDYAYLAAATGRTAMHTRLTGKQPIAFVAEAISQGDRVLELGCGKGGNLLSLRRSSSSISLHGEDITPEHVHLAAAALGSAARVSLRDFCTRTTDEYEVIFALESLCYLESRTRVREVCLRARHQLANAGVFIIVDGFRADNFEATSSAAKDAMTLAEFGFCAPNMPSVEMWIQEATAVGLKLVEHRDLTVQALPYWTLGWNIARFIIKFPRLIKAYERGNPDNRTETIANLVSVCTVAPAFFMGSGKYGFLKFTTSASD